MKLIITLNQNELQLEIRQNGRVLDPAPFANKRFAQSRRQIRKRCGVDSETFSYYHDLQDRLTPLEVAGFKKRGFVIRNGVFVYKELLMGLITGLDKILERNSIDPIRLIRYTGAGRSKKAKSNGVNTSALDSFKIRSELGEYGTSHKIIAAFVEGLKIKI